MGTQPAPARNCWARRRTRRVTGLAASLAKEGSLSDARGEGGARGAGGCVARVSREGVQAQAEPRTRRVRVCSLATDSFLSLGCGRGSAAVSCSEAAPGRLLRLQRAARLRSLVGAAGCESRTPHGRRLTRRPTAWPRLRRRWSEAGAFSLPSGQEGEARGRAQLPCQQALTRAASRGETASRFAGIRILYRRS